MDKSEATGDIMMLQKEHEFQKQELLEARKAIDELKRENEARSAECQEAWKSLQELQNELMRKSMHVGSLGSRLFHLVPVFKILHLRIEK